LTADSKTGDGSLHLTLDDGIVVVDEVTLRTGVLMQRFRVVPVLRERLGDSGTEALTEMVHTAVREWGDEILQTATTRFETRLTGEISALRIEVVRELASMRVELIRWSFVFWITQLAAMAGLLAYVK